MSIEAEIIYDADEPVTEAGRRRPVELVAVSGPRDVRDRHHSDAPTLPALVSTLQHELASITRAHSDRVSLLHDRLEQRLTELERVRAHAMKATLLAERATSEAVRFEGERARVTEEREALARRLEAEQARAATEHQRRVTAERYAAILSSLPWYSFRRRREVRASLDLLTLQG
ncbi:MAG: hypothetical protein KC635_23175 [Myxococcales bacterium]|nr:hypothetical protein [Myxococcales bacterium]MCB9737123.1 hypothetical protein [Deltaproteobacteria bacterium]